MEGAVFLPLEDSPLVEQGVYWSEDNPNPCLMRFIEGAPQAGPVGV